MAMLSLMVSVTLFGAGQRANASPHATGVVDQAFTGVSQESFARSGCR